MKANPSKRTSVIVAIILAAGCAPALAQETADFFKANCASCHTIGGGRLTGPDLKDIGKRRDRAWLASFIADPKAVIDGGDAYAAKILEEARGVVMPTLPGLDKARVEALIALIDEESKKEKSAFAGSQVSDRPLTAKDVATGRGIFFGTVGLKNGGPACIACHTVSEVGSLGGGRLAPDLTAVFERYQGRKTLATWLAAPATPTMAALFKGQPLEPEEVLALVAFFNTTMRQPAQDASSAQLSFVLIGIVGALILLGLFEAVWHGRFRAVRRPLVHESKLENTHE